MLRNLEEEDDVDIDRPSLPITPPLALLSEGLSVFASDLDWYGSSSCEACSGFIPVMPKDTPRGLELTEEDNENDETGIVLNPGLLAIDCGLVCPPVLY